MNDLCSIARLKDRQRIVSRSAEKRAESSAETYKERLLEQENDVLFSPVLQLLCEDCLDSAFSGSLTHEAVSCWTLIPASSCSSGSVQATLLPSI